MALDVSFGIACAYRVVRETEKGEFMKNLFILMFAVSFFSASAAFAEGENMAHKDGSLCDELGKTPAGQVVNTNDQTSSDGVFVE